MSKPSCFCSISTFNCAFELFGLLLSLSLYHPNEVIYILCDSKTKKYIEESSPNPLLKIKYFVELDKYDSMDRKIMEQNRLFGEFLLNKMKIMKYSLKDYKDTLFLDSDIIITNVIKDIDINKQIGLSPQFIQKDYLDKTGYYNAGLLWTNSIDVCNYWESIINHSNHCPEQINMIQLRKYDYFEFNEQYNLQAWRMYLSNESPQQISNHISCNQNELLYKNKPLIFIHTHFHDNRFKEFNQCILHYLRQSKQYKLLLIIYRVIHKKWLFKLPKQPLQGLGYHKNDSYRELPLLMKMNHKDVDLTFINNSIHCWLEPNIMTYDRPTLEWCNNELHNASIMLLGNGDINVEGNILKQKLPNFNVKPWIFWPRRPMVVEKLLNKYPILSYEERKIDSIFIGNFENNVQEKYRNEQKWESVLSEYHCTKGPKHKFTHEEYLMKLRQSKYGLCLRGYGSKCHREVELMAFGCVPIVTPEVSIESYMEPLIEYTHYILVENVEDYKKKVSIIPQKKWEIMSKACYEYYQRNIHSKQCWNSMINNLLYVFDTKRPKIVYFGASVTAQPNGYVDKSQKHLMSYEVVKKAYGGMHLKDAGCFFIDEMLSCEPSYCVIDFFGTGYINIENTKEYIENIFYKCHKKNTKVIGLFISRKDEDETRIKFINYCISIFELHHIPYIKTHPLLETYNIDDLLKDSVHLSSHGANIVANYVSSELLKKMNEPQKINIEKNKYYQIKEMKMRQCKQVQISGKGYIYSIFQKIGPYSPCVNIIHENGTIQKEQIWDKHCAYERSHFNLSNIEVNDKVFIEINNDQIDYELCDNKQIQWNSHDKTLKLITMYYNGNLKINYV